MTLCFLVHRSGIALTFFAFKSLLIISVVENLARLLVSEGHLLGTQQDTQTIQDALCSRGYPYLFISTLHSPVTIPTQQVNVSIYFANFTERLFFSGLAVYSTQFHQRSHLAFE